MATGISTTNRSDDQNVDDSLVFRRFLTSNNVDSLSNLSLNGTRLIWSGDFATLRDITSNTFGLLGKWTSPGGYAKKFTGSNAEIKITWYPRKLNSLVFNGKDGLVLRDKCKYLCENQSQLHVASCFDSNCGGTDVLPEHDVVITKSDQCTQTETKPAGCSSTVLDNRSAEMIDDLKLDVEIVQMQISAIQSFVNSSMQIPRDFDIIQETSRLKVDLNDVMEKSKRLELDLRDTNNKIFEICSHCGNTNAIFGSGLSSNDGNNDATLDLQNTITGAHSKYSNLSDQTNTSFFEQIHAYKAKHRNHLQAESVIDTCNFKSSRINANAVTPQAVSSTIKVHEKHFKQPDQLHTSFFKQMQAYKAKHQKHFLMNKRNASFYNQVNETDKTNTPSFKDQMNQYIFKRKKSFREEDSTIDSSKKIPEAKIFFKFEKYKPPE